MIVFARILFALALLLTLDARSARAESYPNKTLRILVPLSAGSAVDVVARIVADKMSEQLGQAVIVENLPGAAGLVGMRMGAKSAADGYTLLAVNDSVMTMLPHMRTDAGYDPVKDFLPVTQMVRIQWVLVAHPSLGLKSAEAFVSKALSSPNTLTFASGGVGSPQHVAMEILMHASGAKLRHVPYRGVTQGLNDVLSGHVPLMFVALPMPNEFIRTGQLVLLGAAGQQRLALFPDNPTIAEGGIKDFSFYTWGGLILPAGAPPEISMILNRVVVAVLKDPDIRRKLEDLGYEVVANTPGAFTQALKADYERMGNVIKIANIQVNP